MDDKRYALVENYIFSLKLVVHQCSGFLSLPLWFVLQMKKQIELQNTSARFIINNSKNFIVETRPKGPFCNIDRIFIV